ncbi:MAG: cell division protein SepF [Lachnospiraceae bacterium]|jgi:cell division inhibitor SepF|nr:cell division protein SepF [Lachnospiraceae bacterium]
MGALQRFWSNFSINTAEDDAEDDDYVSDEYDDSDEYDRPQRRKFSLFGGRNDEPDEDEEDANDDLTVRGSGKIVSLKQRSQSEIIMVRPMVYDDGRAVVDHLLSGKSVIINFEGIPIDTAQHIIDFVCGGTHALGGLMKKVSPYIFMTSPKNVSLSGDFDEIFIDSYQQSMRGMQPEMRYQSVR